jgi:protocatechuate 3,4-dioxygenase beta subunit
MRNSLAFAIALCASLYLSGCSTAPMLTTTSTPANQVQGAALHGRVHGGQNPISGARVYLYAVDATGYGNASDSLLKSPGYVTTDSTGTFSITGDFYEKVIKVKADVAAVLD